MAIEKLKNLPVIGRAFFSDWMKKINEVIEGVNGVGEEVEESLAPMQEDITDIQTEIGTDETEGSILGRISALESSGWRYISDAERANFLSTDVNGLELLYNDTMKLLLIKKRLTNIAFEFGYAKTLDTINTNKLIYNEQGDNANYHGVCVFGWRTSAFRDIMTSVEVSVNAQTRGNIIVGFPSYVKDNYQSTDITQYNLTIMILLPIK